MILRWCWEHLYNSVVTQYRSIETTVRLQQTLHKPQSTWDVALLSMPTEALGAWQRTPAGDGGIGRVLAPVSRGRAGGAGEGGRPTGGSRHHPSRLLVCCPPALGIALVRPAHSARICALTLHLQGQSPPNMFLVVASLMVTGKTVPMARVFHRTHAHVILCAILCCGVRRRLGFEHSFCASNQGISALYIHLDHQLQRLLARSGSLDAPSPRRAVMNAKERFVHRVAGCSKPRSLLGASD